MCIRDRFGKCRNTFEDLFGDSERRNRDDSEVELTDNFFNGIFSLANTGNNVLYKTGDWRYYSDTRLFDFVRDGDNLFCIIRNIFKDVGNAEGGSSVFDVPTATISNIQGDSNLTADDFETGAKYYIDENITLEYIDESFSSINFNFRDVIKYRRLRLQDGNNIYSMTLSVSFTRPEILESFIPDAIICELPTIENFENDESLLLATEVNNYVNGGTSSFKIDIRNTIDDTSYSNQLKLIEVYKTLNNLEEVTENIQVINDAITTLPEFTQKIIATSIKDLETTELNSNITIGVF